MLRAVHSHAHGFLSSWKERALARQSRAWLARRGPAAMTALNRVGTLVSSQLQAIWLTEGLGGGRRRLDACRTSSGSGRHANVAAATQPRWLPRFRRSGRHSCRNSASIVITMTSLCCSGLHVCSTCHRLSNCTTQQAVAMAGGISRERRAPARCRPWSRWRCSARRG